MPRLSKIGAACLAAFGWTSGAAAVSASYLQVAGGGGGGGSNTGGQGGGGAGGLLTGSVTLTTTLSYTVVVGAGGIGATTDAAGTNGSNSQFGTLTASVGGGGGGAGAVPANGQAGGSGGGAGYQGTSGSGTAGQGNAGGTGGITGSGNSQGGGGGGASAAGGNSSSNTAGNGGNGTASSISGTSVTYAGGGGGGNQNQTLGGLGGSGGGGDGANASRIDVAGTANLGGGGGGGGGASGAGANGGSGVVIISYPSPQKFGGGIVTASGANTIHTFTTSGTLSPLSSLTASYLIVAGGAGTCGRGGAGAGGLLSGSSLTIDTNSIYLVTVGAGGTGTAGGSTASAVGGNSSFSMVTTTAVGGGSGGTTANTNGASGGSGGGGTVGTGTGGAGTAGQGNAGGNGGAFSGNFTSGGGGGAGAAGQAGQVGAGGAGGVGVSSSISGTATFYAGGGGGHADTSAAGAGGNGGGGAGALADNNGTNGTASTGGGAGGSNPTARFAQGGSGVVIISYPGSTQQMAGGTVTVAGGNVIHTFTSSGYLTPIVLANNSLRFRSSASAFLNRTPPTAGNRKTWTFSAWVKLGAITSPSALFGIQSFVSGVTDIRNYINFDSSGLSYVHVDLSGSPITYSTVVSSAVYRDPSAWYHVVVTIDTTQATASNRVRLFVNGSQITSLSTATYPSQNLDNLINNNVATGIGCMLRTGNIPIWNFDGYMTDINFIDGQALTPSSFGTFNGLGVWQPVRYGGSYGTNGFYLPFTAGTSAFAGSFNGSNQSLSLAQNSAFNFGTGDFTVESWIYGNSWSTTNPIINLGDGARGGGTPLYTGWSLWYNTSTGISWYRFDGTETNLTAAVTLATNQWHHIAVARSSGVLRIFVNGVQLYSAANTVTYNNVNSDTLKIGGNFFAPTVFWFNGQISNTRIVNGTAVYTAPFTPPTANLTAITNTQLLTLQNATIVDNSTNAFTITNNNAVTTGQTYPFSASRIFNDQSPQGNNWTPNNISGVFGSTLDYMTDVPTLTSPTAANYCVLNAVSIGADATLSAANLQIAYGGSGTRNATMGTFGMSSGKWYWECTILSAGSPVIGITNDPSASSVPNYPGFSANGWGYVNDGDKYNNGSATAYGATYTTNDIMGVAFDADAGSITFYKNNVSQGVAFSSLAANTYFPAFGDGSAAGTWSGAVNFGQRPFAYTPPSGFLPLNTFNL